MLFQIRQTARNKKKQKNNLTKSHNCSLHWLKLKTIVLVFSALVLEVVTYVFVQIKTYI